MNFKRLSLFIVFICATSIFLTSPVYSLTYYVKNTGSNSSSGLNDGSAWRTIGKVNSFNFADGDIIQFRRGDTFDDANLTLAGIKYPSGKSITIGSYGTGTLPWVGGATKHINITTLTNINLTIQNLRLDGQEFDDDNGKINIRYANNVTINGIKADGSVAWVSNNRSGIFLWTIYGSIEIKNCVIEHWGPSSLWDTTPTPSGTFDHLGLFINEANGTGKTVSIHDNIIRNIEADGIQMEDIRASGGVVIYNNLLWNGGENGLDIKGCHNVKVYNNTIGRDNTFTGTSGSSSGELTQPALNVMDWAAGYASENIEIYQNIIGPDDRVNIRIGSSYGEVNNDINIHHNQFKPAKYHYLTWFGATNLKIHDNYFGGLKTNGQFVYEQSQNKTHFYNNQFYSGSDVGSVPKYGLIYFHAANATFERNTMHVNENSNPILYIDSNSEPTLSLNTYYNENGASPDLIVYKGTGYDATEEADWRSTETGAIFAKDQPIPMDPPTPPTGLFIISN